MIYWIKLMEDGYFQFFSIHDILQNQRIYLSTRQSCGINESYCKSWYSTWINKFDHILRLTHASAYIIMSSVSQKGKLRWRPEFIIIWCRFSLMLDNMWFDLGVPILALILLGGYDYINDTDSFHVLCWWIFLNYGFLIL